jgi:hypothetical protein
MFMESRLNYAKQKKIQNDANNRTHFPICVVPQQMMVVINTKSVIIITVILIQKT